MIKKKYKLIIFIITIICTFITFYTLTFKERDYEKRYFINGYEILETFDKKNNFYKFLIYDKDVIYPYQIEEKYIRKKDLILNIEKFINNDEICILPISNKINFYPLCSKNNEIYTYNLSKITNVTYDYKKISEKNEKYNNIDINFLNNYSYLIYNYRGFYLINENKRKKIHLFNEDIYSLDLVYQSDDNLIIPNYNQKYFFNSFLIIDIKTGKVKEFKFNYDISFDSEFLGIFKNNLYLIDKKSEKQYKINLKKEKIEEVPLQLIKDGKLAKVTFQNIVNDNYKFKINDIVKYEIINSYLYQIINDIKIKISNKEIDKIIKYENNTVYYLCDENLYMYNNTYGEVNLLSNFEWNFNNTNVIYFSK